MELNKVVGNRIRALREEKGLDQPQFCEAFREFRYGKRLAESTLSSWETGAKKPKLEQLIELAFFFDTSVDFIIGRVGITPYDDLPPRKPGRQQGYHLKQDQSVKKAV